MKEYFVRSGLGEPEERTPEWIELYSIEGMEQVELRSALVRAALLLELLLELLFVRAAPEPSPSATALTFDPAPTLTLSPQLQP